MKIKARDTLVACTSVLLLAPLAALTAALPVAFGSMQAHADDAPAGGHQLSGYIGSHPQAYRVQTISGEVSYALSGQPDYLAVTEVYPDVPDAVRYRYSVRLEGLGSYARCQTSKGFGPTTYFIKTDHRPIGNVKVLADGNASRHPVSTRAKR